MPLFAKTGFEMF